jgi:hypothetical protein
MNKTILNLIGTFAAVVLLAAVVAGVSPIQSSLADSTIIVNPQNESWIFTDDGYPGGIGEFVSGPATPPLGSGSVHFVLAGTAREAIGTLAFANTQLDQFTQLKYNTYRASVDAGNNLAVALQLDVDYDLTDTNTAWQGRLVYEPYQTSPGGVYQNTWQTWDALDTTAKWWASKAPGSDYCPQSSPCTISQILGRWPNAGVRVGGYLWLKAGGPADGFDGNADNLIVGVSGDNTTFDFEAGSPHLSFAPTLTLIPVGGTTTVYINLNSVSNLYGYQFQVNYDSTKLSAAGAFVNTWFDTTAGGAVPSGWNASCAAGVCKFAATRINPAAAVNGSGTLAAIVFTGLAPGDVTLTFSEDILSDRDANVIAHTIGTKTITVYGAATVSGVVKLQGRATPIDAGSVKFTDPSNTFAPTTVAFDDTTGAFSAVVPVLPGGTAYTIDAAHLLYLTNQKSQTLNPGDTVALPTTTLKGGDANNDGTITIGDLTCIGGDFGSTTPGTCGGTGSSDINKDNKVNILDLVLAGGNFNLSSPQGW